MFILTMSDIDNVVNYVFTLLESDTSTTTVGSSVAITECDAYCIKGLTGTDTTGLAKIDVATAGKPLTCTDATDEGCVFVWVYRGSKRYAWLHATVGNVAFTPRVLVIQSNSRRQPFIA